MIRQRHEIGLSRAALAIALCGSPWLASAQTGPQSAATTTNPSEAETAARALLREGFAARVAGRDADALVAFRASYRLVSSPRTLAQIALAEHALGQWVDAERDLLAALPATQDAWIRANEAQLRNALATIESHLGSLEILGVIAGAEVRIDGRIVATAPVAAPLRVAAGTVTLEVHAPGHEPFRRAIEIHAGALSRESIVLVPTPAAAIEHATPDAEYIADPQPPSEPATPNPVAPVEPIRTGTMGALPPVLFVSAGALFALSGLFYGMRLSAQSALVARCGPHDLPSTPGIIECPRDLDPEPLYAAMMLDNALSIASLGVGVAVLATGAIVAAVRRTRSRTQRPSGAISWGADVDARRWEIRVGGVF